MPTTNPSALHPNPSLAALPYNSTLSLWLSMDPLSDKYPNLSPYVYCANNPVGLVDVDGRDIYEFDDFGNIKNVQQSDCDIFYKVNENGDRVGDFLTFDRKVVSENIVMSGDYAKSFYLKVDNANDADDIFSFLAQSVELSGAEFSNSIVDDCYGNTFSLIGSDVDAQIGQTYSILNLLRNSEYSVRSSTHNHFADKQSPSSGDLYYARTYPNTTFYIRTNGNICTPYDQNTPPDYDFEQISVPLKGVSVTPH